MKIVDIKSEIILDSNRNETILTTIEAEGGLVASASVPAGRSTGKAEAKNIPAKLAKEKIDTVIKDKLVGQSFDDIRSFDQLLFDLDGTSDKSNLGANTILSLSIATIRILAKENSQPLWKYISEITGIKPSLPTPMMVMIEGGKHGKFPQITWQEFLLDGPIGDGRLMINQLEKYLKDSNIEYSQGLEGGFTANLQNNAEALELLIKLKDAVAPEALLSIDIAGAHHNINLDEIVKLIKDHELTSVEDPAGEEEWDKWSKITSQVKEKTLVIGDDLIVTNCSRLTKAIGQKACNGIIVKPNQIGSISETLELAKLASDNNIALIVSHRAGETPDSFIADLAVGIGAKYLKSGAPTQKVRIAKYDRLEKIVKEMDNKKR